MCLIGLALDAHPRFALVVAANRDEFFDRPAAALDWWQSSPDAPWLLAGRDLSAGGTWFGLSEHGRIGMLTNVRDPSRHRLGAASRGALVTQWLEGADEPARARDTNPYNLIGGDVRRGAWWSSSHRHAAASPLHGGVHALSNAALNSPWPKVVRLKSVLRRALGEAADEAALTAQLFDALADRRVAADADLPDTGIGIERERVLSPAFIVTPDGRYGTRCSTVLIGQRNGDGWRLTVTERGHEPHGVAAQQRTVTLDAWPHRGSGAGERPPVRII
jgi:uncharacterized protein with NRDE domain